MKLRVLTAVVLIPILLAVIWVAPTILTTVIVGLLSAIAGYELLCGTGLVKHIRLIFYTVVMAFFVPIWCHFGMNMLWALFAILLFVIILFSELLLSRGKLPLERLSICFTAGIFVPCLLSALVRIIAIDTNRYLILIPFILAFLSDSGAYFIGKWLGRHKLAPIISPNKSIEGMFGGVVVATAGMLVYCWILQLVFNAHVNYLYAISYGIIGSFAGVFGDLSFSAIKRQTGIKDYGNLIPGHGGVLDRFDSMVIIAPMVEILLLFMPVLES